MNRSNNNITRIVILGITGSVGTQTVKLARQMGFSIVGCSFHSNSELANKIIANNKIEYSFCSLNSANGNCQSFDELIKKSQPTIIVNAIIGFAGLKGTLAALHNKVDLALANKESIVTAGWYIMSYAKKHNIQVIPIDSEHTNLYKQLLETKKNNVNQIFITCSGGKYLNKKKNQLAKITYKDATQHKNWQMGSKITIDSNTLINKCFEVVEAYWYFNTNRISVLHDPTSIIHSALLLNNGVFVYTNSKPLMTGPIGWAISNFTYKLPKPLQAGARTNVLQKMNNLKPISWAYDIINDKTHSLGIIINAADETAIKLFKAKILKFNQIVDYVENVIKRIKKRPIKNINDIYQLDLETRLSSIKYWK